MLKYQPSPTDANPTRYSTASIGVTRDPAHPPANSRPLRWTTNAVVATPRTAWMMSDAIGRAPRSAATRGPDVARAVSVSIMTRTVGGGAGDRPGQLGGERS